LSDTNLHESNVRNQTVNMGKSLEIYSDTDHCPVRNVLDRFGDKWSVLILLVLGEVDKIRFNELHKIIQSISQKMLTSTLRVLEADDLVKRTVFPEIPLRVEYEITERGRSLLIHIRGLVEWAEENMEEIKNARSAYPLR